MKFRFSFGDKVRIPSSQRAVYPAYYLGLTHGDTRMGIFKVLGTDLRGHYIIQGAVGGRRQYVARKLVHKFNPKGKTVAAPVAAPVAPVKPTRTFSGKSQCGMLLTHLASGLAINRIQADHLYRIAALPRRIKDLTEAGHKITSKMKLDPTGRPFAEYAMRNAGRIH